MLLSIAPLVALLLASVVLLGLDSTFWIVSILSCGLLFFLLGIRVYLKKSLPSKRQGAVAFFHPNANCGGGGERVLWCGIKAVQEAYPTIHVVIYCASGVSEEQLRQNAELSFKVRIPRPIEIVSLADAHLLSPDLYPRFTLVGQALGSVRLAHAALQQLRPQVFIDTSGWAFMYPLVRLAGVKVACYTHYPTISTNMLLRVANRNGMYNNSGLARTLPGALLKLAYYYLFACLYGMAGGCANVVMVNSSWTRKHVKQLWWKLEEPKRVFPPCNTEALQALPLERKLKRLYLISVAQFRPEKGHNLQLEAFAAARQNALNWRHPQAEAVLLASLVLVGSCRGDADQTRVDQLKQRAEELGLQGAVEFKVNVTFDELERMLAGAVGGLHAMLDEHFGISIVEYMAAGVIPIAHNSGGPKEDILTAPSSNAQPEGFLCETVEQYADAITRVLTMEPKERRPYAIAARRKAETFSDALFEAEFLQALQPLLLLFEPQS